MSLYRRQQKGPYWYEFVVAGVRFRGSTGTTDREEAKRVEARARASAGMPSAHGHRPEMTLNQAAERYYQEIAAGQPSASTTDAQLADLVRIIGGGVLLSRIDDPAVAAYVSRRRGEKSRNAPRDHKPSCRCARCALAPATVNREVQALRRVLRRANRAWKVSVSDVDWGAHLLPEPAERVRELTAAEETALFAALRPDYHPIIRFLLATGVRKADAVTLTWRQVDWQTGVIRLRIKSNKPGGQPHLLPITGQVAAILQGEDGNDEARVFTYEIRKGRTNGKTIRRRGARRPFDKSGMNKAWRQALAAAGIEDFRLHDLRHTAATRVLRASGNLKVTQRMLGHANIATTARYGHAMLDDIAAAMEAASPTKSPTLAISDGKKT